VRRDITLILRLLRHPKTPAGARIAAVLVVGYIFSPIQFIPTFILFIGQLDDGFVITLGTVVLKRLVASELLDECSSGA
jgi:uncharacterized membrane protein YkvA (DUF1232 family)